MTYIENRKKYTRPQAMIWAESDNIIDSVTSVITNVVANGTAIVFTGSNTASITTGNFVTISGITPSTFNFNNVQVTQSNATTFTVSSNVTGTYTSGGTAIKYISSTSEVGSTSNLNTFLILSDHNRSEIDLGKTRIENRQRMINGRMRSFHVADKQKISVSWNMLPSRRFSDNPLFNTTTGQSTMTGTLDQHTVDGGAGGADLLDWYDNHTGPFWVYLAYDKPSNFQTNPYDHLTEYIEPIEMYIADFSYTVVQRGGSTFDFWNVSVTLEEV